MRDWFRRKRWAARGTAGWKRSRSRPLKNGSRNIKSSGKARSTIWNDFSVSRKKHLSVRRNKNGNNTTATGNRAPNKTHVCRAAGTGVPRVDRRETVRAMVSSHNGIYDDHYANGFAQRRCL